MDAIKFGKLYEGLSDDARTYLDYILDEWPDTDMADLMDKWILQAASDDGTYGYDGDGDTGCQYCAIRSDGTESEWSYMPEWVDAVKGTEIGRCTRDGAVPVLVWLRDDQKKAIDILKEKGVAPIDFMRGAVDSMLSTINSDWR